MESKKVVGLSATKGGGKSTLAKLLVERAEALLGPGATGQRFPFAGALKEFCVRELGLREESVYGSNEEKDAPCGLTWADTARVRRACDEAFGLTPAAGPDVPDGPMSGRDVMQYAGMYVREAAPWTWVSLTLGAIARSSCGLAVVDDVRFPNEVHALQAAGGVVYRLTRSPHGFDGHASERALDPENYLWPPGAVIDNASASVEDSFALLVAAMARDGVLRRRVVVPA